jgi:hypothetical protein
MVVAQLSRCNVFTIGLGLDWIAWISLHLLDDSVIWWIRTEWSVLHEANSNSFWYESTFQRKRDTLSTCEFHDCTWQCGFHCSAAA